MKILVLVCRVLLGLLFVVFGLNGFLHFIPMGAPPPPDALAGKFMASMMGSGWLTLVSGLQVIGGLLVLLGGTAPLGLVILGPVVFNALLFHVLLAGGHGIAAAAVAALLEIFLIYAYREHFVGLFTVHARPTV